MKSMKCYTYASMFLVLMLSTLLATAETNAIKGKSNTKLGSYQIKECSPIIIEGQSFKAFELSYEKSNNPILIYIDESNNCKDYIVRSKYVEIKYVCKKSGFGVEPVFGKHMKYDNAMNNFLMDPVAYKNQMKLSESGLAEKEALQVIASSFPKLLKSTSMLM
jgi:hypothetical protein